MDLELLDTFPSGSPRWVVETVVEVTVVLVKIPEMVALAKVLKQRVVLQR